MRFGNTRLNLGGRCDPREVDELPGSERCVAHRFMHEYKDARGFVLHEQLAGTSVHEGDDRAQMHWRSEEHTSELQSLRHLVCRLLLEKKNDASMQTMVQAGKAAFLGGGAVGGVI